MRRAVAAGAAVAWALATGTGAAAAATLTVGMPGRAFQPQQLTVVTGDTVRWANTSGEAHDVEAADGSFGSGTIGPGGSFERTFEDEGRRPYVCALHRASMAGEVTVVPVILTGPGVPVAAGEHVTLEGRVPAGSGDAVIERARDGEGFTAVARVTPAPDGTFTHTVRPEAASAYRAVTPRGVSPIVSVAVVDRVRAAVRASSGRRLTTLRIATAPARPGATAIVQLYSPERFRWRRVATGTLDADGRMLHTLPSRVRRRARVVVLGADGTPVATSPAVPTWRTRLRAPRRPPAGSAPAGSAPAGHHDG